MGEPALGGCGHRDGCVELGLVNVVGDEGEERGVAVLLELALDKVGAATAPRRDVGDAHHAVDALAVNDSLPGRDAIAAELDALPDRIPVPTGLGDDRGRS